MNASLQCLSRNLSPTSFHISALPLLEHLVDLFWSVNRTETPQKVNHQIGVVSFELLMTIFRQLIAIGGATYLLLFPLGKNQVVTFQLWQLPSNSHGRKLESLAQLLDGKSLPCPL